MQHIRWSYGAICGYTRAYDIFPVPNHLSGWRSEPVTRFWRKKEPGTLIYVQVSPQPVPKTWPVLYLVPISGAGSAPEFIAFSVKYCFALYLCRQTQASPVRDNFLLRNYSHDSYCTCCRHTVQIMGRIVQQKIIAYRRNGLWRGRWRRVGSRAESWGNIVQKEKVTYRRGRDLAPT